MRYGVIGGLLLAGCDRQDEPRTLPQSDSAAISSPTRDTPGPTARPSPTGATPLVQPPPATVRAPSESRDPAVVLDAWAHAVEAREWSLVRLYWGDKGARSGLTPIAFARAWDRFRAPRVTIDTGDQEGAAGSLYYTAPVTIADGAPVSRGEIVIRRVNDVDGATPEQLRWHIESLTITP